MKDWIDDLNNLLPKGRVSVSQEDILDHSHDAWSVSIKTRQQGKAGNFIQGEAFSWGKPLNIKGSPWFDSSREIDKVFYI